MPLWVNWLTIRLLICESNLYVGSSPTGGTKIMKTDYTWNNIEVKYCHLCECFIISCDFCKNSSCNGGGCKECSGEGKIFNLFSENYKVITKDWAIPPYEKSAEQIMLDEIFLAKTASSVGS